jgi:hypothetical protein
MLTDDVKAITQLIDMTASKLRSSEHSRQLAILRSQLLTLLSEAARAEEVAVSGMTSSVPVTRQIPAESGVADSGRPPPPPVAPFP